MAPPDDAGRPALASAEPAPPAGAAADAAHFHLSRLILARRPPPPSKRAALWDRLLDAADATAAPPARRRRAPRAAAPAESAPPNPKPAEPPAPAPMPSHLYGPQPPPDAVLRRLVHDAVVRDGLTVSASFAVPVALPKHAPPRARRARATHPHSHPLAGPSPGTVATAAALRALRAPPVADGPARRRRAAAAGAPGPARSTSPLRRPAAAGPGGRAPLQPARRARPTHVPGVSELPPPDLPDLPSRSARAREKLSAGTDRHLTLADRLANDRANEKEGRRNGRRRRTGPAQRLQRAPIVIPSSDEDDDDEVGVVDDMVAPVAPQRSGRGGAGARDRGRDSGSDVTIDASSPPHKPQASSGEVAAALPQSSDGDQSDGADQRPRRLSRRRSARYPESAPPRPPKAALPTVRPGIDSTIQSPARLGKPRGAGPRKSVEGAGSPRGPLVGSPSAKARPSASTGIVIGPASPARREEIRRKIEKAGVRVRDLTRDSAREISVDAALSLDAGADSEAPLKPRRSPRQGPPTTRNGPKAKSGSAGKKKRNGAQDEEVEFVKTVRVVDADASDNSDIMEVPVTKKRSTKVSPAKPTPSPPRKVALGPPWTIPTERDEGPFPPKPPAFESSRVVLSRDRDLNPKLTVDTSLPSRSIPDLNTVTDHKRSPKPLRSASLRKPQRSTPAPLLPARTTPPEISPARRRSSAVSARLRKEALKSSTVSSRGLHSSGGIVKHRNHQHKERVTDMVRQASRRDDERPSKKYLSEKGRKIAKTAETKGSQRRGTVEKLKSPLARNSKQKTVQTDSKRGSKEKSPLSHRKSRPEEPRALSPGRLGPLQRRLQRLSKNSTTSPSQGKRERATTIDVNQKSISLKDRRTDFIDLDYRVSSASKRRAEVARQTARGAPGTRQATRTGKAPGTDKGEPSTNPLNLPGLKDWNPDEEGFLFIPPKRKVENAVAGPPPKRRRTRLQVESGNAGRGAATPTSNGLQLNYMSKRKAAKKEAELVDDSTAKKRVPPVNPGTEAAPPLPEPLVANCIGGPLHSKENPPREEVTKSGLRCSSSPPQSTECNGQGESATQVMATPNPFPDTDPATTAMSPVDFLEQRSPTLAVPRELARDCSHGLEASSIRYENGSNGGQLQTEKTVSADDIPLSDLLLHMDPSSVLPDQDIDERAVGGAENTRDETGSDLFELANRPNAAGIALDNTPLSLEGIPAACAKTAVRADDGDTLPPGRQESTRTKETAAPPSNEPFDFVDHFQYVVKPQELNKRLSPISHVKEESTIVPEVVTEIIHEMLGKATTEPRRCMEAVEEAPAPADVDLLTNAETKSNESVFSAVVSLDSCDGFKGISSVSVGTAGADGSEPAHFAALRAVATCADHVEDLGAAQTGLTVEYAKMSEIEMTSPEKSVDTPIAKPEDAGSVKLRLRLRPQGTEAPGRGSVKLRLPRRLCERVAQQQG